MTIGAMECGRLLLRGNAAASGRTPCGACAFSSGMARIFLIVSGP